VAFVRVRLALTYLVVRVRLDLTNLVAAICSSS